MKVIIDMTEEIKKYVDEYIPVGDGVHYCYPDEIVEMLKNGEVRQNEQ